MSYPTIADAQLTTGAPADEALIQDGITGRDTYNWSGATSGTSGVDPNSVDLQAAVGSHIHDGSPGNGEPIDTPGIADDAINNSNMLATGAVTTAKLDDDTVDTSDLAGGAVTIEKLTGTMGHHISGSHFFDYGDTPGGVGDEDNLVFKGDVKAVTNLKGKLGVCCNFAHDQFFIHKVTSSLIYIGIRTEYWSSGSGTWAWDFWII